MLPQGVFNANAYLPILGTEPNKKVMLFNVSVLQHYFFIHTEKFFCFSNQSNQRQVLRPSKVFFSQVLIM